MADVGAGAVKIIDNDGDSIVNDSGELKVSIGAAIDLGDVEVKGHATMVSYQNDTVGTSAEKINQGSGAGGSGSAESSILCKHVDIMAAVANTGIIYVGGVGVTAATGIALYGGDVYSLDIEDVDDIYVLAIEDGENVQFTVYN